MGISKPSRTSSSRLRTRSFSRVRLNKVYIPSRLNNVPIDLQVLCRVKASVGRNDLCEQCSRRSSENLSRWNTGGFPQNDIRLGQGSCSSIIGYGHHTKSCLKCGCTPSSLGMRTIGLRKIHHHSIGGRTFRTDRRTWVILRL